MPGPKLKTCSVAPRTGAWIETKIGFLWDVEDSVAPRTGAWIETKKLIADIESRDVAPRTGAWIETEVSPVSA